MIKRIITLLSLALLMAGGGLKRGFVYGASDSSAAYPKDDPCTPDDVAATMFYCMGIDPATELAAFVETLPPAALGVIAHVGGPPLGKVLDLPPGERLEATLATTALAAAARVDIVRVHDVGPNVRTARMADAVVRSA